MSEDKELVAALKVLNKHLSYMQERNDTSRHLWIGFLRGIVYGLGILVAFAIVVPILLAILSTFDWIPFIGDIITEIILRIESAQPFYNGQN